MIHLCSYHQEYNSYLHLKSGQVYRAEGGYGGLMPNGEYVGVYLHREADSLEEWLSRWLTGESKSEEEWLSHWLAGEVE